MQKRIKQLNVSPDKSLLLNALSLVTPKLPTYLYKKHEKKEKNIKKTIMYIRARTRIILFVTRFCKYIDFQAFMWCHFYFLTNFLLSLIEFLPARHILNLASQSNKNDIRVPEAVQLPHAAPAGSFYFLLPKKAGDLRRFR